MQKPTYNEAQTEMTVGGQTYTYKVADENNYITCVHDCKAFDICVNHSFILLCSCATRADKTSGFWTLKTE